MARENNALLEAPRRASSRNKKAVATSGRIHKRKPESRLARRIKVAEELKKEASKRIAKRQTTAKRAAETKRVNEVVKKRRTHVTKTEPTSRFDTPKAKLFQKVTLLMGLIADNSTAPRRDLAADQKSAFEEFKKMTPEEKQKELTTLQQKYQALE